MTPRRKDDRERLVAIAARLLAEEGLPALTTRRLAQAAGVAHGLLYNHFENKDDLVLAALSARTSQLVADFDAQLPAPGAGDLAANLSTLATALVELQERLAPMIAALIGHKPLLERFARELHAEPIGGPDRILRAIHDYLEEEQRFGAISATADVHVVGVLLFALTQLQALVNAIRGPDRSGSGLEPFVAFFTATLDPH